MDDSAYWLGVVTAAPVVLIGLIAEVRLGVRLSEPKRGFVTSRPRRGLVTAAGRPQRSSPAR